MSISQKWGTQRDNGAVVILSRGTDRGPGRWCRREQREAWATFMADMGNHHRTHGDKGTGTRCESGVFQQQREYRVSIGNVLMDQDLLSGAFVGCVKEFKTIDNRGRKISHNKMPEAPKLFLKLVESPILVDEISEAVYRKHVTFLVVAGVFEVNLLKYSVHAVDTPRM